MLADLYEIHIQQGHHTEWQKQIAKQREESGQGVSGRDCSPPHVVAAEGYHQQCLKKGGCMGQNGARQCYAPSRCYGS
ncbi:TPA: hypothetical protein ACH3X2_004235 [Trebouxia sp. C0005]